MRMQLPLVSLLPFLAASWAKPAPNDATTTSTAVTTSSSSTNVSSSSAVASTSSQTSVTSMPTSDSMSSTMPSCSMPATASGSTTSSTTAPQNTSLPAPVAYGYVASYHIEQADDLKHYPWSNYTHMSFFGTPAIDDETSLGLTSSESLVQELVSLAHQNNVKAMLTIGGYGNASMYFSSLMKADPDRNSYANLVTSYAFQHGFDGIDIDWEYPNYNKTPTYLYAKYDDTSNFLSFLKTLKSKASNLTLSAAAPGEPWLDMNQKPWTNMSEFASVLDYVVIMNYDRFGSWSPTAGPNAPLNDSCVANATQRQGSAVSSLKAWTDAGFPAQKLLLGVPAYGHGFPVAASNATTQAASDNSSSSIALYPAVDVSRMPLHGDKWDSPTLPGGTFSFQGLMDNGYLQLDGTPADGIVRAYDNCTATPYLWNNGTQVVVSYDDAESMKMKGEWVKQNGLAGFAMFEVAGDHENILLGAVKGGLH
ncbi:glycoside hydrolase [Lentinus tigrinus ALCF2SS1-7]|uniref:Glycoside hydrolase n=1 Tax=Lentinus tigrinus ALCF2SS1-6 TaxID=1328759 RepID=A0A5C2S0Q7_9APHY|nr:glycoside hydrolase [Lentinus tigrinus ALCF2SS1-6]RPD71799.1 glycoside hydrolase [Lentinus tigrinus ALCF2SS1-7]